MKAKARRERLDILLVERGLADSAQKALAMILAGEVQVDGSRAAKAGDAIAADARIEIFGRAQKFASRGGFKLEGALEDFSVNPAGSVCLDVGSSTGGFTDCLLQYGAKRTFAVDVNLGQLAWKLQQDPRVTRFECNAREIRPADFPERIDLVVVDVSFISVGKVLAPVVATAKSGADFLVLIKPQFELPKKDVGAGGIVTDVALHEKAIEKVRRAACSAGLECLAVRPSRLAGAEGNQEYFLHARKSS
jgi:23S rRNA (cytidine1920-2'-O)/16S rRNA (cytidine1409-2'-O)-methyltransferase